MSILGPGQFYMKAVKAALKRAGMIVATVDVTKTDGLFQQVGYALLESGRFTSCVALGVGHDDMETEREFAEDLRFRERVIDWVERGGRFVVQGENAGRMGNWPEWFDKTWDTTKYGGDIHECRAKSEYDVHWCSKWYSGAKGAVTTDIHIKSVMMTWCRDGRHPLRHA